MPGDVVYIPANVKHWHGASKDSWFSHISIEIPGEDTSNEWLKRYLMMNISIIKLFFNIDIALFIMIKSLLNFKY